MESPRVDIKTRLEEVRQRRAAPAKTVKFVAASAAISCCAMASYFLLGADIVMMAVFALIWATVLAAPWLFILSDPFRSKRRRRVRFSLASLLIGVTLVAGILFGIRITGLSLGQGIEVAVVVFLVLIALMTSGVFGTFQSSLRRTQVVNESPNLGAHETSSRGPGPGLTGQVGAEATKGSASVRS